MRPSRFSFVAGFSLVASSAFAFAACGGSVGNGTGSTQGDGGGVTSEGGTTVSDSSTATSDGSVLSAACPATPPFAGSACTDQKLACEYGGEGPYLACSTIYTCGTDNTWKSNAGNGGGPGGTCVAVSAENDPACPASYEALAPGEACPVTTSACVYPEGKCECANCFSPDAGVGAGKAWSCVKWPAATGCPTPRPRLGSSCASEGLACHYAVVCSAVGTDLPDMKCESGLWRNLDVPQPPCAYPQCTR